MCRPFWSATLSWAVNDGKFSRMHFNCVGSLCLLISTAVSSTIAIAEQNKPTVFESKYLVVHTDLPADKAKQLLLRMEQTLKFASKYWGRNPARRIECYVIDDLKNWKDAEFPHRLARVYVGGVSGATIGEIERSGKSKRRKATVYASSDPGVAEHEIVHAYCSQTFGYSGPPWYKEGMAELAVIRSNSDKGVIATEKQITMLRKTCGKTNGRNVSKSHIGQGIEASLNVMLANPKNDDKDVPLADWTKSDAENVLRARDAYLQSWAFCYMMLNNPNYASRFRTLGKIYLTRRHDAYNELFSTMQREIAFEYNFFLKRIDNGYRIDLCRWDWNKRFRTTEECDCFRTRVDANRGFQASGLSVEKGQEYSYQATGEWSVSANGQKSGAGGRKSGSGQLVGVVLNNFNLSKPILLGTEGTFIAPSTGNFYLRCQDTWNELSDNVGKLAVEISRP